MTERLKHPSEMTEEELSDPLSTRLLDANPPAEKLTRRERQLCYQLELAEDRLKAAHRVQGRQGRTIAELRGELARTREEHSKLDRGELRKLEKFADEAIQQIEHDRTTLRSRLEEIKRLREKLSDQKLSDGSGLSAGVGPAIATQAQPGE
jgi:chromosome segregation ATPase